MKATTFATLALSTAAIVLTMLYLQDSTDPIDTTTLRAFADFKAKYNKSYASVGESRFRFGVFKDNLQMIQAHKAKKDQSYTLDVNEFADLTFDEFKSKYLMTGFKQMKEENEDNCGDAESAKGKVLGLAHFLVILKLNGDCLHNLNFSI